jgi:hypothetical protein
MADNERLDVSPEGKKISDLRPGDVIKYAKDGTELSITVPDRGPNSRKDLEPEVILVETEHTFTHSITNVHLGILMGIQREVNGRTEVSDSLPERLSPGEAVLLDKFIGGNTSGSTVRHQFPGI